MFCLGFGIFGDCDFVVLFGVLGCYSVGIRKIESAWNIMPERVPTGGDWECLTRLFLGEERGDVRVTDLVSLGTTWI